MKEIIRIEEKNQLRSVRRFLGVFMQILFFSMAQGLQAQNETIDVLDDDAKFRKAQNFAFTSDRAKAKTICYQLMKDDYADAFVLLGRIFAWDANYDSSRMVLNVILKKKPLYYDAMDALIDLDYWEGKDEQAVAHANEALVKYKDDVYLMLKKAKALNSLKQTWEAMIVLVEILAKDSANQKAKELQAAIKMANLKNRITASYNLDYFAKNSFDPQHLAYIQYSRITPYGSIIGRINYANRFLTNGLQFEVDAYPSLGKKMYGYANLGFAQAGVFPGFRTGADVYRNFSKGIEASIGFRYLKFSATEVALLTPYIGKYFGNYLLGLRAYLTPDNMGLSTSAFLSLRRYFQNTDSYLGLRVGYGLSPDDRRKIVDEATVNLRDNSVRFEYSKKIRKTWIIGTNAMYEYQEFFPGVFRQIYSINGSIAHIF